MSKILGVIPARLGSTRLKEKLLIEIAGKPIIQWTYEGAKGSRYLDKLLIATDSDRIEAIVRRFGGEVAMTPSDLKSGTDRVAYLARELPQYEYIINIQGDEPMIKGSIIDALVETLVNPPYPELATIGAPLTSEYENQSFDSVKVACRFDGYALYFSRYPIPFGAKQKTRHIGIYGYKRSSLLTLAELAPPDIELSERLEQLRALYYGINIMVKILPEAADLVSLDTESDLLLLKSKLGRENDKGQG